jgi:hypothetical protein
MKTSNKILIAFASALILVPILGMVYVSRALYKVGSSKDIVEHKIENFNTATAGMTSIQLKSPFQSVSLEDAKGASFGIRFVKDEKFGVKIPDAYKNVITASVDANGQLQLVVKDKQTVDNRNGYISILIYAPNLTDINIANANSAYVTAMIDSLSIRVKKVGSMGIGSETHIGHLSLTATDVQSFRLREDDVKSLTLNLTNANFNSEKNSYDLLSITTAGNCELEINGNNESVNQYSIKNLVLTTMGKADVKLENIKAISCSGSFSDETTVNMPAVNLNQMFKK